MTTCADSTALRAHLDHPDPELEAHLDGCQPCAGLLAAVAADAGTASRALAALDADVPTDVDVAPALAAALARRPAVPAAVASMDARRDGRRLARVGARLAAAASVAVMAIALAVTPAGQDAVAQILDGFRGEQLQVVAIDPQAMQLGPADLEGLQALGPVDLTGLNPPDEVPDVAAAEAVAGIAAPALADVPDRVAAAAPGTATLTLLARDGNGVPAELDGAVLEVSLPGVIVAVYGEEGAPELVVGRAGSPTVQAIGAPLADVREFLLERPELPEALRSQLVAIEEWRTTLPLPVPVDGPGWDEVTIAGRPGLAFGDGSGLGALVIRQDPDGFTAVGGMRPVDELLAIAAES